jgi:hypothetical protein
MENNIMIIKILIVFGLLSIISCTMPRYREELIYEDGKIKKYSYQNEAETDPGQRPKIFLDPVEEMEKATIPVLPNPQDFPFVAGKSKKGRVREYKGLIQNYTKYDVSIPSSNSGATLIVPANGWLEYVNWEPNVRLKGFVNGKQVYYQSLRAQAGKFKYMGNSYDFLAEIQPPPEPAPEVKPYCPPRAKPKPKKRKKRIICPT